MAGEKTKKRLPIRGLLGKRVPFTEADRLNVREDELRRLNKRHKKK